MLFRLNRIAFLLEQFYNHKQNRCTTSLNHEKRQPIKDCRSCYFPLSISLWRVIFCPLLFCAGYLQNFFLPSFYGAVRLLLAGINKVVKHQFVVLDIAFHNLLFVRTPHFIRQGHFGCIVFIGTMLDSRLVVVEHCA